MLAAVLALALAQTSPVADVRGPIFTNPATLGNAAFFEFAPPSGVGLPVVADLCGQLQPSERVGNWWCVGANGSTVAGSTETFTVTGLPVATTNTICPSGPNCTVEPVYRMPSGAELRGTVNNSGAGSMTVCGLIASDEQVSGTGGAIASQGPGLGTAPTNNAWALDVARGGGTLIAGFGVSNGVSFPFQSRGIQGTPSAWHLVCGVFNAAGQTVETFFDGSGGGPVAAGFATRTASITGTEIVVHGTEPGPSTLAMRFRGTFFTETALSSARIAALARAVLADAPTGSRGEAVTYARAGPRFCPSSTGEGSIVPPGRPCVTSGQIVVEPARDNNGLRAREFNDAVWTSDTSPAATVTVTANQAIGPEGALTADRVQFPSRSGVQWALLRQNVATIGNVGVWVAGNGSGGTISLGDNTLTGAADCVYEAHPKWTLCTLSLPATATVIFIGSVTGIGATSGSKPALDVFLWGAQGEASVVATFATTTIPTESVAVTRGADDAWVDLGVPSSFATFGITGACVGVTGQCSDVAVGRYVTVFSQGVTGEFDALYPATGTASTQWFTGATSAFGSTLTRDATLTRWVSSIGSLGGPFTICKNGICQSGATRASSVAGGVTNWRVVLGNYSSGAFRCGGGVTNVKVDVNIERCR